MLPEARLRLCTQDQGVFPHKKTHLGGIQQLRRPGEEQARGKGVMMLPPRNPCFAATLTEKLNISRGFAQNKQKVF